MTDSERDRKTVRDLGPEFLAHRQRKTFREKLRALLAREPHPKPARISGPRLVADWHEPAGQALLPLAGPRCLNPACRESMLPGSGLLSEREGFCGACQKHPRSVAPRTAETDDQPPHTA